MKVTKQGAYRFAAIGFSFCGVVWAASAIFWGDVAVSVSLSTLHLILGLMFLSLSQQAKGDREPPQGH